MISRRTTSSTSGWMLDLDLTDKQEKLYALIYSKTDCGGRWAMTAKDVAIWCRCSVRHARRLVRELEDMGLIVHEVVSWKKGNIGGTQTEFWAIDPEKAIPAPDGSKTRITWEENGGTPGDMGVTTPGDMGVTTPYIDSNNNIHTTSNTKRTTTSRDPARVEPSAASFVPPTVEEVAAYAETQGFADPAGFADFYIRYQTEAEWMTGKGSKRKKISNWKLNVIQWSIYRKDQIFNEQKPARASEPARKECFEISDEEFSAMFGI